MSDCDFRRLSAFVKENVGISLSDMKKTMLQARLQKRLKALELHSYSDYCEYLFSPEGIENEIVDFINVVTTNKTDFFREPHHFDFLVEVAVPYLQDNSLLDRHHLNVWSAACSSGMEPYTIAMSLAEHESMTREFSWAVLGTDVSTKVLGKATEAVYDQETIEPVPMRLRKKYLLRSSDRSKRLVKIVPELRSRVEFRTLNFLWDSYGLHQKFEVVFCRNVLIYFDRKTVFRILEKITSYLIPGGFLFLGHSESLNGYDLPFDVVGTTIYQKKPSEG